MSVSILQTTYGYIGMSRFFHPLLMVLARATESQLARYVEYLKAENRILRDRLPKRVVCTPGERQGDVLGKLTEGQLYRLVGKLTLFEAGEEQFEATMLVESENNGEPLIWPVSLPLRSKERMKYDYISLHASGASIYRFDDIRFGNSWEAVTSRNLP